MGEMLERIYGILFQPAETLRAICQERPLKQALFVIITAAVFMTWTGYFAVLPNIIFVIAAVGVTLTIWFVGSAITHLVAELIGGKGQATGLLAANGYVQVLRIFSVPLIVLASLVPASFKVGILLLGSTGLFSWEVVLTVIALRENYGFSTKRACLTLVVPYLAVFLFSCVFAAVIAKVFFQSMAQTGLDGIMHW